MFATNPFSNRWLVMATGFSFVLLLASVYLPFLRPPFGTVPLTLNDWLRMVPFMLIAPIVAELVKASLRWRTARRPKPATA